MRLSFEEVAALLAKLYEEEFGGKAKGRFKISRKELAEIAGRAQLKQGAIDQICENLADDHGLLMIDLGDEFPVTKISILRKYRAVPSRLIAEYAAIPADDEDED